MRMPKRVVMLVVVLLPLVGLAQLAQDDAAPAVVERSWRRVLADRLPLYGHRNWVVIADAAYPAAARDGVETVVTGAEQIEVVRAVLTALDGDKRLRPVVYTDAELKYVPEQDAPGVEGYRQQLAQVLGDRGMGVVPHEEMLNRLDKAGETYRVLVLKTNMTVPYSSVFLQLDYGYWTPAAEQRLRDAMK